MANTFERLLAEKPYLLADGATGTNLFQLGLQTGDAPELWNTDHPDRIQTHYRSFVEAGSDIILTNTFGANAYRLKLHQAEQRVRELNVAAVQLLREEIEKSGKDIAIAGSMGPTGEILEPAGPVSIEEAADVFEEQAHALADAGVDVLWLETLSSTEETIAGVLGASRAGLPIVTTLSIDTNGRTMMGITAADIVNFQSELKQLPHAFGTNCGVGANEVVAAVLNFKVAAEVAGTQPIIVAKANCGIPEYVDGAIVYNGSPEVMARYTEMALDAGARIIGGCCGTSPLHLAAMRTAMDNYTPGNKPDVESIERELGELSTGAKAQLSGDLSIAGGSQSGGSGRGSNRRRKR